jgi:Amt family ammonium transporter
MKNFMDFSLGSLFFWFIGFSLIFGTSKGGIIGTPDLFVRGTYGVEGSFSTMAHLIFQTVFCATAATIVSGGMAERTKFSAYCIYSIAISAVVYPISAHWIWGGGWLGNLGFHDFAGSTAVHMVGGVCALVGAKILGPRIGKYTSDGKSVAIPGHSLTLGALGVFLLWFGWFGFNGGSTVSMTGDAIASASAIFVTTNLAAAAGGASTMLFTWIKYGKPDVSMTLNGVLGGLVAITAGCDAVSPAGAAIIGVAAGVILVPSLEFIDKVLKIDDPVGAAAVHGVCGALGTILTGVFAVDGGLLYGGGFKYVGIQILGVAVVAIYVAVIMAVIFTIIKSTIGIRVTKDEEISGLDLTEHALISSYADFAPSIPTLKAFVPQNGTTIISSGPIPVLKQSVGQEPDKKKMTKVTIVTRESRFDALKQALNEIGITGLTVSQVMGAGMQRGHKEYYRGVPVEINLLPKIRVEIVVCKVPVSTVVETARKVLYTGGFGDGKIFTYNVENVVRIRTGEVDYDALQDE